MSGLKKSIDFCHYFRAESRDNLIIEFLPFSSNCNGKYLSRDFDDIFSVTKTIKG